MTKPVIQVRDLSKSYQIRSTTKKRYHSLRDDLMDGIKGLLKGPWQSQQTETFWALKDINFDVNQGDIVGIIGRNGAGKSTLLKILSQIVPPTSGEITIRGRIGSLLEVGTGFHPELTGRENIFMNGAVLGMKRLEISRKFDEIVAFAEVEKFLDTPVKFYSSGMYVRLAFAVAAHLEPEILIVDEVLAVGDAAFQKKCLGKMEDVGKEGRTVIFVSHNMATVSTLCQDAIWLMNGKVHQRGSADWITSKYLIYGSELSGEVTIDATRQDPRFQFRRLSLLNVDNQVTSVFDIKQPIKICLEYTLIEEINNLELTIRIYNSSGVPIFSVNRSTCIGLEMSKGDHVAEIEIPSHFLVPDTYSIDIGAHVPKVEVLSHYQSLISFEIEETGSNMAAYNINTFGVVLVDFPWKERIYA